MMLKRPASSCVAYLCDYVIADTNLNQNANANGELHVRNTRAWNNSFHLNYRSKLYLCLGTRLPSNYRLSQRFIRASTILYL